MARNSKSPVQQFRGTVTAHRKYTGPIGEITVCIDDWSLRVHDGYTKGGVPVVPVGTICLFPLRNTPAGWANCAGSDLDINQYNELYQICGTRFGTAPAGKFKIPLIDPIRVLGNSGYESIHYMIKLY